MLLGRRSIANNALSPAIKNVAPRVAISRRDKMPNLQRARVQHVNSRSVVIAKRTPRGSALEGDCHLTLSCGELPRHHPWRLKTPQAYSGGWWGAPPICVPVFQRTWGSWLISSLFPALADALRMVNPCEEKATTRERMNIYCKVIMPKGAEHRPFLEISPWRGVPLSQRRHIKRVLVVPAPGVP